MGGKSKAVTVGYKHYVGMHCVFCHGPIDLFTAISCDDRVAWQGSASSGTIAVSANDLFGGESREGGFAGSVDVQMGGMAQTKNAYLLSKIGPNIPAYRGVAALVFKDFYWGNNPYLKPVSARGQRVYTVQDGALQWRAWAAGIGGGEVTKTAQSFKIDWLQSSFNLSQNEDAARMGVRFYGETGQEIGSAFAPMTTTDEDFWTARSLTTTMPAGTAYYRLYQQMQRNNGVTNNGYITAIQTTINGQPGQVWNPSAASGTDGWVTEAGALGYYSELMGRSCFMGGSVNYTSAYQMVGVGQLDLNGAHIIRECLTNQDWGMGYAADDIDDVSLAAAADTLFEERLGLSLVWDKQTKIEDFINEVVRHIDAALFVSRSTGKFVLKLIRADYDPATLLVLDESNIEKITDPRRPEFGELVNSVTVQFNQGILDRQESVTFHDSAEIQKLGQEINTTLQYPGFSNVRNASIACARDLRALSNPFLSCTVHTGEVARDLEPGDVFKLTWGKWKLNQVVMRVTGFALSEGKSDVVRLTCVEDVFSTPLSAVYAPPPDGWVDPSQPPEPVEDQLAMEAPYYELVQTSGQTQTDTDLTTNPLLGYVLAAAVRPGSAINAKLWTDAGGGFEEADTMDFAPSAKLVGDMGKTTLTAVLTDMSDLDLVPLGTHCQIGDELLRVDSLNTTTGSVTFGRGVLDTVPQLHSAGDTVFFWDLFAGGDPTEYADGETVDVRITPVSGAGQVPLADALESTVTLDQRAYRPYPPGNLTINGESYVDQSYAGTLTVAWAHRDRLQQTSGELADHFDGNIGPEAGTTYRVRAYIDGVLDDEQDDLPGTDATVEPVGEGIARVEVHSKRDGVYSMQGATHEFPYLASGAVRMVEESNDYRVDEDDNIRVTED